MLLRRNWRPLMKLPPEPRSDAAALDYKIEEPAIGPSNPNWSYQTASMSAIS